ncbi:MAG TPA: FmdB family zinc ribbon protein [Candidatus Dormibacteraeota bacterium]
MPIYGYRCSQCGHELEVRQSMSDEPLRVCPECSGSLRKLLYPVGVQFKGKGFYSTDYKRGGDSAPKAEKNGSNGSSDSKESGSGSGSSAGSGESSGGGSSSEKKSESVTSKE